MSVFFNSQNELRSGWKFAIYVVLFLIIWVATGIALSMVRIRPDSQVAIIALNAIALFVPAVSAMWLTVKFVDHRPFRTFGIGFLPRWQRHFGLGILLAAGMVGVLAAGCFGIGYVSIHWTGRQVPATVLVSTFSVLLLSALNEELVFRGFPLQLLIDGIGEWPAIIGMSALFGAVHWSNENASVLGILNTIVAGVLLSLAYVRTRSLWMPYAIHVGWNVGLGFVLGLPLSGFDLASLWTTGIAGSETILGGDYGPEGGLLATFIFASAALIVHRYGSIYRTEAGFGSRTRRNHRSGAAGSR